MQKFQLMWLRIKKFFIITWTKAFYPNVPWDIAYTDIKPDGVYAPYPDGQVLAEFDADKHYVIIIKKKE